MTRNRIALSLCALAGLMALACSTTKPVMAQARPALVKNVDEKGRNPYQVTLPCKLNGSGRLCYATINPVPTGKRLVLQFVNAFLDAYSTQPPPFVTISDEHSPVLLSFVPVDTTYNYFIVNSSILLYVDPGKTITFSSTVAGSYNFVTFTGYLVDVD